CFCLSLLVLALPLVARAQGKPYLVEDLNATLSPAGSNPTEVTRFKGFLFFIAMPFSENELWRTDGTAAGTFRIKRLGVAGSNNAMSLAALDGSTLVFTASDMATGREIWRSDGTAAGTVRIGDLNPGPADSVEGRFTVMNGIAYYV